MPKSNNNISIKEICAKYKYTQSDLAREFEIPLRTVQNWYNDVRTPPEYIPLMIEKILEYKKTVVNATWMQ